MTISNYNNAWFPTLFNEFFDGNFSPATIRRHNNVTAPAVNVIEEEKAFKVEVAAPGMSKEDFTINIDKDNNLVINMEKRSDSANTETDNAKAHKTAAKYLRREFSYSKFQQAFLLPEEIELGKITASMLNGVLTIDIPKKEPVPEVDNSRQINIL